METNHQSREVTIRMIDFASQEKAWIKEGWRMERVATFRSNGESMAKVLLARDAPNDQHRSARMETCNE